MTTGTLANREAVFCCQRPMWDMNVEQAPYAVYMKLYCEESKLIHLVVSGAADIIIRSLRMEASQFQEACYSFQDEADITDPFLTFEPPP